MKNILLYLWQLPQNLLGLAVVTFTRAEKKGDIYYTDEYRFGVSLGNYIIFGGFFNSKDKKHEQGHQKQSLYLGWLYLLVIGLPSVIGNLLNRVIWFDYYKQPWEAWADKLGGVERC
jgi:hypothetical protein